MTMAFNPKSTTVLITGASSGIGYATALYLAEKGYTVIGTSRSAERLEMLSNEIAERGLPVHPIVLDINSDDAVREVLPRLIEEHAGIDVLVNNAGYGLWGPGGSLSIDELRTQFETNFFAPFKLTKLVLPGMIERRHGTIVNISSVLGQIGTPFNGAYVSTKFALEGLSEAMRTELWPFGVRVTVVEPGLYATEFQQNQLRADEANLPDSPYREYIDKYNNRHGSFDRLSKDPIAVSKVIHKIIRSKRPRFRYAVGAESHLGILGKRYLPQRLFQFMLSRATLR
jgi:short-subunit dehydrogenase